MGLLGLLAHICDRRKNGTPSSLSQERKRQLAVRRLVSSLQFGSLPTKPGENYSQQKKRPLHSVQLFVIPLTLTPPPFWDSISYIPGWPQSCYVAEDDLNSGVIEVFHHSQFMQCWGETQVFVRLVWATSQGQFFVIVISHLVLFSWGLENCSW